MSNENNERIADMPAPLRWFLVAFKQVGFPVMVCVWLAYNQFVSDKETVKALHEFKEVMVSVKDTLEQQNRILRRKSGSDE